MEEKQQKKYPYLGRNYVNDKQYIVLFTEEDMGVVVLNECVNVSFKFGDYKSFDERLFEVLPPDVCVRLSN